MSFSSFKKEQMIFENFRKFINEEVGQINELSPEATAFVKNADAPITEYIPLLKKIVADPEFRAIAAAGKSDAGGQADEALEVKPDVTTAGKLFATQKEIGFGNSLKDQMKKPGWGDPIRPALGLKGSPIEMPCKDTRCAILTFGGKRILDGHHRWSQIMMMSGPEAQVAIDDLQPTGILKDVETALKVMQLGIALNAKKVVTLDFEGDNLMDATREQVENYVIKNISDETLKLMVEAEKIAKPDKRLAAKHIGGNLEEIQKRKGFNKFTRGAVMPQAADSGTKQDTVNKSLATGMVNFDKPSPKDAANRSTVRGMRGSRVAGRGRFKVREAKLRQVVRRILKEEFKKR